MSDNLEMRDAIRAEVRAYVRSLGARYIPALVGVLALLFLVVVVPDRSPSAVASGSQGSQDVSGSAGASAGTGGSGVSGVSGVNSGSSVAATTPKSVPNSSGVGGSQQVPGGSSASGPTNRTTTRPGGTGVAVTGAACTQGARQFTWAPYAPNCVPKFTGNNGGATSHGVTPTTITVTFRRTSDQDAVLSSQNNPTPAAQAADTQTLINYFNSQYELYGRHVVFKSFQGNGNWTAESGNQDQAGAAQDAQTAYDLGAFAEVNWALGSYDDALNSRHILTTTLTDDGEPGLKANAPYRYLNPILPVGNQNGLSFGAVTCQRMKGLPAKFAGTPYQAKTRKFAVIDQEQNPQPSAVYEQQAAGCGVKPDKVLYTLGDFGTYPTQAVNAVQKLQADGDTTVMIHTDTVFQNFLFQAATNQKYFPEWVSYVENDSGARNGDASQMAHYMVVSPQRPHDQKPNDRLCNQIFKRAAPGRTPQSADFLDVQCTALLAFYEGLQAAGPDLTPLTFQRGWFSEPDSTRSSDFGSWSHAAGQYSPAATFNIGYWNANGSSPFDGKKGYLASCDGGAWYSYKTPKLGSGQLKCFGG